MSYVNGVFVMLIPEISLVVARAFSLSCNITPVLKSCAPGTKEIRPQVHAGGRMRVWLYLMSRGDIFLIPAFGFIRNGQADSAGLDEGFKITPQRVLAGFNVQMSNDFGT